MDGQLRGKNLSLGARDSEIDPIERNSLTVKAIDPTNGLLTREKKQRSKLGDGEGSPEAESEEKNSFKWRDTPRRRGTAEGLGRSAAAVAGGMGKCGRGRTVKGGFVLGHLR